MRRWSTDRWGGSLTVVPISASDTTRVCHFFLRNQAFLLSFSGMHGMSLGPHSAEGED